MSAAGRRYVGGATVALVVLFGVLSARSAADRRSWRDEDVTAWFARLPWSAFWHRLHLLDAVETPYYLLLRPLPDSLVAYRLVSVVAMVAAVACAVVLARHLAGPVVGPVAGLVTAAVCLQNHVLLSYAAQARGYALATFGVTALALVLAVPRPRWAPPFVVLAVVGHLFAALPVALLLAVHRVRDWRPWTALAATAVPLALAGRGQVGLVSWIGRLFGDQAARSLHVTTDAPLYVAAAGGVAAVLLRRLDLLVWWLGPVIVLESVSVAGHAVLWPRYVVESAPAFAVLAGCSGAALLGRLRPPYPRSVDLTGSSQEPRRHSSGGKATIAP